MYVPSALRGRLLLAFADLLDYPGPRLVEAARRAEMLLEEAVPEAVQPVRAFRTAVERVPPNTFEEVYTAFFDLNPVLYPYVGYHLFGETYKRSLFLVGLRERFREHGFDPGPTEMPDRLSVVLRFAAHCEEDEQHEVVAQAVLPALRRLDRSRPSESDGREVKGDAPTETDGLNRSRPNGSDGRERLQAASGDTESESGSGQLEGDSLGEQLSGGFLLEMAGRSGPLMQVRRAYVGILAVVRLLFEMLWADGTAEAVPLDDRSETNGKGIAEPGALP